MKSVNRVSLLGYIGNDLELRTSQNDVSYVFVNIATTKAIDTGKSGKKRWKEVTEWNSVSVWGSAAEYLCQYADVGSLIYFEGRIDTRKTETEDTDGNPVYRSYIGGRHVVICRNRAEPDKSEPETKSKSKSKSKSTNPLPYEPYTDYTIEDDIPF